MILHSIRANACNRRQRCGAALEVGGWCGGWRVAGAEAARVWRGATATRGGRPAAPWGRVGRRVEARARANAAAPSCSPPPSQSR